LYGSSPMFDRAEGAELLAEVGHAGLLGRGGAGFPMARKLAAVRSRSRRNRAVVVANGTEGEPAVVKDRVLLARSPHLVLDGAVVAAQVVGAQRVVVVVRRDVEAGVEEAVSEREAAGIDPVRVELVVSAPGFVAGEASAVVNRVTNGRSLPRMTPPRLAQQGIGGRPTLVQNVETLAHLALVARYGAAWFRTVGDDEPGSMLVTLAGAAVHQGVHEVALGTPLRALVELAGTELETLAALLVGGYSGTWVRASEAGTLRLSRASLARVGASPGAGLVALLPQGRCGLAETAQLVRYLADESVGQCGPCLFGLDAIAGALERLAVSGGSGAGGGAGARGGAELTRLTRWLAQVEGRGACGHPDGVVRLVRSALLAFSDEVEMHRSGRCSGRDGESMLPVPAA
jgi:NADH:ubiquinone oxidoreductase subunit F (NADH-binding)